MKDYFLESISAIILNYNRVEDTINCVNSLRQAGLPSKRIWVIDNGSEGENYYKLKFLLDGFCHIIRNKTNLGYAKGMNLGIRKISKSQVAKWFLIMNNDTKIDKSFFDELFTAVQENPLFDILGPVILSEDEPTRIWFFGGKLIPKTLITFQLHKNKKYSCQYPSIVSVDFISGCCMFIKSEVFNKIGYFNEKYFMYGEDVDFCWRALKSNMKLGVVTRALMWHKISASSSQNKNLMNYLRIKNQNDFYRSNSKGLIKLIMFIFSIYSLMRNILINVLHEKKNFQFQPYIKGWISGWCEK